MRILIVDDDPDVLFESTKHFSDAGDTVCKARGGKEGLKVFGARGPFDVVLTDYDMPDLNGVDLSHDIRKWCPDQKIVINTGCTTLAGCMEAFGLEDVPVVSKHLGLSEIDKVVRAQ